MTVILDTHAVVWAMTETARLPKKVKSMVDDPANTCLVSCASLMEIATKVRLGKWPEAANIEPHLAQSLRAFDYGLLLVDAAVALRAGRLTASHGDPFDRLISAHALLENIPLISIDRKVDAFGVRRIW